jgi:hypothetical protein
MFIMPRGRLQPVLRLRRLGAATDLPIIIRSHGRLVDGDLLELRGVGMGRRVHPVRRVRQVWHLPWRRSALI